MGTQYLIAVCKVIIAICAVASLVILIVREQAHKRGDVWLGLDVAFFCCPKFDSLAEEIS